MLHCTQLKRRHSFNSVVMKHVWSNEFIKLVIDQVYLNEYKIKKMHLEISDHVYEGSISLCYGQRATSNNQLSENLIITFKWQFNLSFYFVCIISTYALSWVLKNI